MSKEDISAASWIANLGLAVALAGAFAGIPLVGMLVPDDDEAIGAGLVVGAMAGVIVGGVVVGVLCQRAGLSRRVPLVTAWASPGTLISLPLLGAIVLTREWQSLPCVVVLTLGGTLATLAASSVARLRWR